MPLSIAAILIALNLARVLPIGVANSTEMINVINDVVLHFKEITLDKITIYMVHNSKSEHRRNQEIMRKFLLERSRMKMQRFIHLQRISLKKIMPADDVHIIIIDTYSANVSSELCSKIVKEVWKSRACLRFVYMVRSGDGMYCPTRISSCSSQVVGTPADGGGTAWMFRPVHRRDTIAHWMEGTGVLGSLQALTYKETQWNVMVCNDPPFIMTHREPNGQKVISGFLKDIWDLLQKKIQFRAKVTCSNSEWRGYIFRAERCLVGLGCMWKTFINDCTQDIIKQQPDVALLATSDFIHEYFINYDFVLIGLSGRVAHYSQKRWKAGWHVLKNKELLLPGAVFCLAIAGVLAVSGGRFIQFFAIMSSQRMAVHRGSVAKLSAVLVALLWILLRANFASTRASFRNIPWSYNESFLENYNHLSSTKIYRITHLPSCYEDFFLRKPTPYVSCPGYNAPITTVRSNQSLVINLVAGTMYTKLNFYGYYLVIERERILPYLSSVIRTFTQEELIYDRAPIGFLVKKGVIPAQLLRQGVLELSERGVVKALFDKWFLEQEAGLVPWRSLIEDMYLPVGILLAGIIMSLAVLYIEKQIHSQPDSNSRERRPQGTIGEKED